MSCNGEYQWPVSPLSYESKRASKPIKPQGRKEQKLALQVQYVFSPFALSISAEVLRNLLSAIFCGQQWPSMDTGHSLLWTPYTTCGGGQFTSMDSLRNLLRPAKAIDGHICESVVVGNIYPLTVSPVFRYHGTLQ